MIKAFIIVSHVEEVSGNGLHIQRNARSLILDAHLGGHLFILIDNRRNGGMSYEN